MAVTASLPEVRARSGAARILLAIVVLVLIAIVCLTGWAWWTARANLPQLDGAIAVPGLSSQVRVVRDEQGVPTIEAATLEDLFFAQGYVTAQDRLWQMDIMRRAAAGELSEVVGEATLKIDRQQRILGLRSVAEAAAKKVEGRDRAYLEAYARGVNAFIDSHPDLMPMEFRLLVRILERSLSFALSGRRGGALSHSPLVHHRFVFDRRQHGAGAESLRLCASADPRKDSGQNRA